jgi:PKD repeat protein
MNNQSTQHNRISSAIHSFCKAGRNGLLSIILLSLSLFSANKASALCSAHLNYIVKGSQVTVYDKSSMAKSGYGMVSWGNGTGTTLALYGSASHTYTKGGRYHILYQIRDSASGCFDTTSVWVTITGCTATASFTFTVSGTTVSFTNNSTGAQRYDWSFGDGNTSVSTNPSNTYASSGAYTVTLRAYDTINKCVDTAATSITIGTTTKTYSIYGKIWMDSSTSADHGTVLLIGVNPTDTSLYVMDSAQIDSMSNYAFTNLKAGIYYVKAFLANTSRYYSNYLPTYHAGSLTWGYATSVALGSGTANVNVNIQLIKGSNPGGLGFIGGKVSQGANKKGDPLASVRIVLTDDNSNAVATTTSDANGNFSFLNLAYGKYHINTDVLNVKSQDGIVIISASAPSVKNLDVEVGSKLAYTTIRNTELPVAPISATIYPNPASDVLHLNLHALYAHKASVQVMDYTGRVLLSTTYDVNAGVQNNSLNIANLSNGIYFVKISFNNGTTDSQYKFVKSDF